MTNEQKDLLMKDICSRLPYGVVIQERCLEHDEMFLPNKGENRLINIDMSDGKLMTNDWSFYHVDEIKPYLFPLSSMTEEQKLEFIDTCTFFRNSTFGWTDRTFDWLNKNHFDFRDLIPMGLAIDCTNLNVY